MANRTRENNKTIILHKDEIYICRLIAHTVVK